MIDVSLDDFQKTIDKAYWYHIRKKTLLPYEGDLSKNEFLGDLHRKVANGAYFVSSPRAFIVQSKQQRIARVVPVLGLEDYCVYYFCIKQLEEHLAVNRVPNTYGGFSLGGLIRESEEAEIEAIITDVPSSPTRAYNKFGWVQSWSDYQAKAWWYANNTDATQFLALDIANFYDTIDLDKLESKIRHAVPREKNQIVNLLFSFLKNWNRKIYGYGHQSKGIPQDEVGDCSRILANFFLQSYDSKIYEYCNKNKITYLRYADDQIFMSESQDENLKALYEASILLHREGLNINAAKVKEYTEGTFSRYWAFEIFSKLKDKTVRSDVLDGIAQYLEWCEDVHGRKSFRADSVLSRILSVGIGDAPQSHRHKLLAECLEDEYLLEANSYRFKQIFEIASEADRPEIINQLISLSSKTRFCSYLYELLDLQRKENVFTAEQVKQIDARIMELAL